MAASKEKLLRVLEIIRETDEDHPLTAEAITEKLRAVYGIEAERKSVCRDLATLVRCGWDVVLSDDNKRGYYLRSREFEDWELKILEDAVGSAKFLTESQTATLCRKLRGLASEGSRRALELANVPREVKRGTPGVKLAIEQLLRAIACGCKVRFRYVWTDDSGREVPKHPEGTAPVSPYTLIWRRDRFFLIGNYAADSGLSYYRLDRIRGLELLPDERALSLEAIFPQNAGQKLREFVAKNIYERKGPEVRLGLRVAPGHADDLRDSFGGDVRFLPGDGGSLEAFVTVTAGEGLYRWLLHHAGQVTVIKPESVRTEFVRRLRAVLEDYTE